MQKLRRMAERGGVRDAFGSRGDARGKGGKLGRVGAALSSAELERRAALAARRHELAPLAFLEVGVAHPGVELCIGSARVLIDQRVVAGLGNIYVSEALLRSGISPKKLAGAIRRDRLERLAVEVRNVIEEAIEAGGSTISDFGTPDGELGYFQHRFRVYDKEGRPCPVCAKPIRRLVQSGRSTFYCAGCQR